MDMDVPVLVAIGDDVFSATPASQTGKWRYISVYILGKAMLKRIRWVDGTEEAAYQLDGRPDDWVFLFWAEPGFAMPPMVNYEGRKDTAGNGIQDFATLTAHNERIGRDDTSFLFLPDQV